MLDTLNRYAGFLADFSRFAGRRGLTAAVLVACGAVLEGVGVLLLVPFVSLLTAHGFAVAAWWPKGLDRAGLEKLLSGSPNQGLMLILGLFAALMTARAVALVARDRALADIQLSFVAHLRLSLAGALAAAGWPALSRLRHADIGVLMDSEIQRCGAATFFLVQAGVGAVMLAAAAIVAAGLSPVLAVGALAILAVIALALGPALTRTEATGEAFGIANLALGETSARFLGGLKLAISQNLQHRFIDEFAHVSAELKRRQIDFTSQQSWTRTLLTSGAAALAGGVIAVGLVGLHLTPPILIAFLVVLTRITGPAMQIQQGALQLAHTLPAYERVLSMIRSLEAAPPTLALAGDPPPAGEISLHGVGFRHPGGGGVSGIDLALPAGVMLGVRGPSGSGKTTLADLVVGLLSPQVGEIRVGGRPLDGAALTAWRANLAYVAQDPFMFHDTVRANLIWAADADDDALWAALRLAGAEALVRGMPAGLETVVGDRGALISGGERQRLALARALLRRPQLLVLDEATNAIDPSAERTVLQHLADLDPRPTVIVIAHRPESLSLCDRLISLEGGRLVDDSPAGATPNLG